MKAQTANKQRRLVASQFNPLAELLSSDPVKPFPATLIDDASLMAEALIQDQGENSAHWTNSARDFVRSAILYLVASEDREENNLTDLLKLITEAMGEKNGGEEYSDAPTSFPTIANVTVITTDGSSVRDGDPSTAHKFDDSIKTNYYNVLDVKADASNGTDCIAFSSDGLKNAAEITFNNSVLACASEFADATQMPANMSVEQWYENGGVNQRVGGDADVISADGFSTNTSSTDVTISANDLSGLDSSFFDTVDYIGAVSDQDTSSAWYQWVEAAVTAANND